MDNSSMIMYEPSHTKSDYGNRDSIATYIRRIRDKLLRYIPQDATSQSINVEDILENHLENCVVETIKESIPAYSMSDLNPEIIETIKEAARLTFMRNQFLLDPKGNLTQNLTDSRAMSPDNVIPADSYVMNMPRTQSSRRVPDDNAMEVFNTIGALVDKGKHQGTSIIDVGNARGLTFKVRLRQHNEIKKMLTQPSFTMYTSINRQTSQDEQFKKQSLVKDLMQELNAVVTAPYPDKYFYMGVEKLAELVVDGIIKTAKKKMKEYHQRQEPIAVSVSDEAVSFIEKFGSFTAWPKVGEFNVEVGADRIADYMATWYYDENWLYDLDMVMAQSDACSDFYIYEVKWSIPSQEYPIPQATASVFFTMEVSRVIPKDCYVYVTYKFEGSDYLHEPFKHQFHEKWLFNIIDCKLKFFQTITF